MPLQSPERPRGRQEVRRAHSGTAGRHALESNLIQEMKDIHAIANADHKLLVMDAALGQQASEQAKAFNEAVQITGVIITNWTELQRAEAP